MHGTTPQDEAVDGSTIVEEISEQAESCEGATHALMSQHHFWLPDWGSDLRRRWDAEGVLHVTRSYRPADDQAAPCILVPEVPYARSLYMGTGGVVWPASLALARFLYERRAAELLRTRQCIVEIGAGCGVPGLCAALMLQNPACRVFLTDESQGVLTNLRRAVGKNAGTLIAQVEVAHFVWEEFLRGAAPAPAEGVDLLLGSDVVWGDRGPVVVQLAARLLRPGGALVVSAEEGRHGLDAFEGVLDRGSESGGGPATRFDVEVLQAESLARRCRVYVCHRRSALADGGAL